MRRCRTPRIIAHDIVVHSRVTHRVHHRVTLNAVEEVLEVEAGRHGYGALMAKKTAPSTLGKMINVYECNVFYEAGNQDYNAMNNNQGR